MADAVTSDVVFSGGRRYVIRLINISDGTGESLVTKVDISGLTLSNGQACTCTRIEEIQYSIQGMSSVRLYWDHTTDDVIDVLPVGNGFRDYVDQGGLSDPQSSGGTGDILLTTNGQVSGGTYDITLSLILS